MKQHNKLVQCKNTKCIFNKKKYVEITDTLQYCCNRKTNIIRLDEEGKCAVASLTED